VHRLVYFLIAYSIIKLYLILDIYQQSHYHIRDYFKFFINNFVFNDACVLIAGILGAYSDNIWLIIFSGSYLILYCLFYFQLKVKLVFSKRIIKLISLSILYIIAVSFIPYANPYLLLLIEFSIVPILYLEGLVSNLINRKYIISAKDKLDKYKGIKVVITGSYGKTSTKLLFNQLLNVYHSSIQTPKSYNTPLGISKFINNEYIDMYRYLVLEYGASQKNDIKRLLDISKPDVAIVTEIGFMHMNSFKTIENVIEEKMLITKNASVVILNYDNDYIRNYPLKHSCILSYGFFHGDYNARNINGGAFDLYYKNEFVIRLESNLVGKHQILNLLAGLSYAHYKGFNLERLKNAVKLFKVEANRLELKKYGNRHVLDDSFNSNLKGFVEALRVLGEYKCKRILITPGIVELGKYQNEIYNELALHIAKNVDVAILVGYKECKSLYEKLKKYNMELYVAQSFIEGYSLYLSIIKGLDSSALLIENDLPDIYKRGLKF